MLNRLELFALNLEIEDGSPQIFEAVFYQSRDTVSLTVATKAQRDLWLILSVAIAEQIHSPLTDQIQENMGLW